MSDHVKRGMMHFKDRGVTTDWEAIEDGNINSVVRCKECGEKIELRNRRGNEAYISLGCPCGAESLDVRIGGYIALDVDSWENDTTVTYNEDDAI